MYDYAGTAVVGMVIMVILGLVAVVGGFILHITFLSDRNEGRYHGTLGKLYEFLTFRKLCIEWILRCCYSICVCVITAFAISLLFSTGSNFFINLLVALLVFFLGNLFLRISYELTMLTVLMCKNIIQINKKMGKILTGQTGDSQTVDMMQESVQADMTEEQSSKTSFCKNCGAEFTNENAKFCTKCGSPRS